MYPDHNLIARLRRKYLLQSVHNMSASEICDLTNNLYEHYLSTHSTPNKQKGGEMQYRAIRDGELIEEDDMVLADNMVTWQPVPKSFIGHPARSFFRPMRRRKKDGLVHRDDCKGDHDHIQCTGCFLAEIEEALNAFRDRLLSRPPSRRDAPGLERGFPWRRRNIKTGGTDCQESADHVRPTRKDGDTIQRQTPCFRQT